MTTFDDAMGPDRLVCIDQWSPSSERGDRVELSPAAVPHEAGSGPRAGKTEAAACDRVAASENRGVPPVVQFQQGVVLAAVAGAYRRQGRPGALLPAA